MQGHSAQQWVASNQTPPSPPSQGILNGLHLWNLPSHPVGGMEGPGEGGLGEKHMLWQIFQGEYQVNSCCVQMIA